MAGITERARSGSGAKPGRLRKAGVIGDRTNTLAEIVQGDRRDASLRMVDPAKVRMWPYHNRLYEELTKERCADLIESIKRDGQQMPAIVRAYDGDDYDFEVIAGARRHFAVSSLRASGEMPDLKYLVEVRDLSDEQAFILADNENRNREDISDYERALDYQRGLESFYSGNAKKMAEALKVDRSWLRRFLQLAQLPQWFMEGVPDPIDLNRYHAQLISPLLADPAAVKRMETEARACVALQESAAQTSDAKLLDTEAYTKRVASAGNNKQRAKSTREIKGPLGSLVKVDVTPRGVTVRIPRKKNIDVDAMLSAIEKQLVRIKG